jgi:hypothetical protein
MRPRDLLVVAMLGAVIAGCASGASSTTPSATPADVAGTWRGGFRNPSGVVPVGDVTLVLQQNGTKLTGSVSPGGDLDGVVDGNNVTYTLRNGRGGGDLAVKGDEMTGYSRGGSRLDLKRVR